MKKIILITICLLGLHSFAQNGTIKGKIIDKLSEKPLQGVTVQLVNSDVNIQTDENGNFILNNIVMEVLLNNILY